MNTLDIRNATVTYPDGTSTITVLDNASLSTRNGEITFIVGQSGSGKSTLLSVAAGLIKPDSGTVTVAGEELTAMDDTAPARLAHIGIIFQQANLLGALTVAEQLLVTDHVRGIRGAELRKRRTRANDLLALVGLADLGDRRIQQLSGGQRQRVGIARALMGAPELLLADEPTSALDAERSASIVELLRSVVDELDLACLFVTHDEGLLLPTDTVLQVQDGKVRQRLVV